MCGILCGNFRGMKLIYLPAYSPDLNPIEEAFSSIKSWLRAHHTDVLSHLTIESELYDPYNILFEAIFSVTSDKIAGWYHDSGYIE